MINANEIADLMGVSKATAYKMLMFTKKWSE